MRSIGITLSLGHHVTPSPCHLVKYASRNYSAVMPECFYRASRFPLAAPLDSR